MTSQLEESIQQYYHEVESLLVCKAKTKRSFMAQFRDDVQSFINECESDASMADIQEFFGTPENIANGFLDSLSSKEIKKAINWKKVLLIGVGLVLLGLVLYMVVAWIDGHLAATGYHGGGLIENGIIN